MYNPQFLFWSFLKNVVKLHWCLISCNVIVAIIWAIDFSLRPYMTKIILDLIQDVTVSGSVGMLIKPVLLYFCLTIFVFLTFRFYEWIFLRLHPNIIKHIGEILMTKLMNKSHRFFQNQFSGSLANKVGDVANGMSSILETFIDSLLSNIIALILATYTMYTANPKLSLVLILWIVAFLGFTLKFSERASKLSKNTAEKRSNIVGLIVDILTNILSVRAFATKDHETLTVTSMYQEFVRSYQTRNLFFMKMHSSQEISFVIYQASCFAWLLHCIKYGTITPGDFAMVMMLNISIIDSLYSLSRNIRGFAESFGNVVQGLQTIYSEYDNTSDSTIGKFESKYQHKYQYYKLPQQHKGEIRCLNISFAYPKSHQLFSNISIVIPPCQKLGLVGYSGSGKSTFMNLILGLFEVTNGQIFVDGQDINIMPRKLLYNKIGIIPQDITLFNRTLMENIRYGRIDATDDEVINAAKKAKAHTFISNLQEGYNSLVGERGIKLSGGERQRIAIARAILKNAPILLMDEATNQLDSVTEHEIQESLNELMHGKTTIVIAHRLSTILHLDRILVFDNGEIVQDGSHLNLMKQGGLYATLLQHQSHGLLPLNNISTS